MNKVVEMVDSSRVYKFNAARKYFEPYGLTCVYWQPTRMQRPDYHNEIELNFLSEGQVTYLYGGYKITLEAGRLAVFWAAIPHQVIDYSPDVVYFAATIPLQTFWQWRMPDSFVQSLLQGQFWQEQDPAMAESDVRLFRSWERNLKSPSAELEHVVMLEMQVRMFRFGVAGLADTSLSKPYRLHPLQTSKLSKVEQMACYIMKNYRRKITTQQVCQSAGLSPNYAMNLFRRTFGSTIGEYLIRHRLSHAQRFLATTNLPITEVALESGFGSISRFNEVFRLHNGCSPRQYRQKYRV